MPTWAELREEADRIEGEAYEAAKPIFEQIKEKYGSSPEQDSPFQREIRRDLMNQYSKIVGPYLNSVIRIRALSWKVHDERRGKSNV